MLLRRFAVFTMIFAPVVNVGLGPYGDSLSLLCALLIGWFAFRAIRSRTFTLEIEVRHLVLILALTLLYALVTGILIGDGDALQLVLRPIRAFIMFFGVYVFVQLYARRAGAEMDNMLVHDVFIALGAHAIIMIAEFVFPSLRDLIYPWTFADQVIEWNQSFRMAGVTSAGGSQLSVYQSIGLLLYPFVLSRQKGFTARLVSHVLALCIALSLILSGRSGIICAVIFMPLAFYWSTGKRGASSVVALGGKLVLIIAVAASLMGVLRGSDWLEPEQTARFEVAATRGIDFFFASDAAGNQASVREDLESFLIVPDDATTLLFGNPPLFEAAYWMGNRIVNSDLGYVIFLFGYGILGSLLQYGFYGLILLYAIRYRRYSQPLANISILLVFVIMLFHAKEVFVFTRIGLSMTTLFIAALLCMRRLKRDRALQPEPVA
jgi:hypothetical protein